MTIIEAQNTVDKWIRTIGVKYYSPLTNLGILTEEVGEMARFLVRIYGEQSFKNPISPADAKERLSEEMADVFFVLLCLANQCEIDLTEALEKSLQKKTLRDKERHQANTKLRSE